QGFRVTLADALKWGFFLKSVKCQPLQKCLISIRNQHKSRPPIKIGTTPHIFAANISMHNIP
ncbi:MAG: hypothetical protein Q8K46_05130, partial [Deltaproteobacteria bacterium]|nr:hypothetical protein [Deltaproteobacteria bacterium]